MAEVHQDLFASYVPMDRRQMLANGRSLPETAHGTVLFADISGFTPLTSALAIELGPELGVEMLSAQLNQVYGALISKVHQYGGSVITFAGDAITCWFDDDSGQRAVATAAAMQRVMLRFQAVITPGNAAVSFGIKIAIVNGRVKRFLAGHPRIMSIDILAGRLMDRVAAAEKLVSPGEVILCADVLSALGDKPNQDWRKSSTGESFVVLPMADDDDTPETPWPLITTLDTQISRNWMLPPVYQRLSQGLVDYLAELRPTVALFAQFDGIDYDDDPEAGRKLDAYICWVQTVLARYEGYMMQVMMGDKGSHFYALFGAPIAHEDDAARAVAAALELQQLPGEFGYIEQVKIGISQGVMYVGAYGGEERRTYGGLGSEVNVAARLMSRAKPSQILVSASIAKTAVQFHYKSLGEASLKGVEAPVPIFVAQQRRSQNHAQELKGRALVPMVGRATERALIKQKLNDLLDGRSCHMLISGEAGIGKSRLVAELLQQAQQLGMPALIGAGDALEQNTPYHVWRAVFRAIFAVSETDSETLVQEKVRDYLANEPHLLERAPLLNAVLPQHLADNDLTAQMSGDVRASNTRDVLVSILQHAPHAVGTLLLILEDAHWMDSASWALMEQARKTIAPLLLVVVTRPFTSDGSGAQIHIPPEFRRFEETAVRIDLTTLPPEEALTLVCRRLGVDTLPQVVASLIQQRAEGHPFYSEELAYALRDTKLIRVENGRCHLTASDEAFQNLEFPDTIQGVITSRVDRLTPGQQLTLKVASVIGRVFFFQALHDIHPLENDRTQLFAYLETLEQLDITPLETPEPNISYIFKHVTIQEVAYSLLLFSQRQQLHRLTAEWLESTHANDLAPYFPLLAHHWQRAEVPGKAIAFLEKAAEEALRNGAFREVIGFMRQLTAVVSQLPPNRDDLHFNNYHRARWQLLLGDAHFGLGELLESRQYFLEALRLLGWPMPESPPRKTALHLLKQFVNYLWLVSAPERVRFWLQKPTPRGRARRLAAAHAYEPLGLVYYFANETIPAVYTALHRFILAKQAHSATPDLTRGYASVCGIFMLVGLYRLGREYGRQAREIARRINDQPALAWALLSTSVFSIGVDKWHKIEAWLEEGIALNERLRDQRSLGDTVATYLNALYFQAKYEASLKTAVRLETLGRESGNIEHVAWGLTGQGNALLKLGQEAAAFELYQAAIEQFSAVAADFVHEAEALGMLAVTYLKREAWAEARETADKVYDLIINEVPSSYVLFSAYGGIAQVYLTLWQRAETAVGQDEMRARAQSALKAMGRFARLHPVGRPRYHLLKGQLAAQSGAPSRARRLWQKGIKIAEKMDMGYESGLLHAALGQSLPATHPQRLTHLQTALAQFEAVGAVGDTAVVQAAINK